MLTISSGQTTGPLSESDAEVQKRRLLEIEAARKDPWNFICQYIGIKNGNLVAGPLYGSFDFTCRYLRDIICQPSGVPGRFFVASTPREHKGVFYDIWGRSRKAYGEQGVGQLSRQYMYQVLREGNAPEPTSVTTPDSTYGWEYAPEGYQSKQFQEEPMNEKYYLYEVSVVDPKTFFISASLEIARSEQSAIFELFRNEKLEGSIDDYDVDVRRIMQVRDRREFQSRSHETKSEARDIV